ncbi:MAG: UDP-N-acetylmuramate dehydrogenase [Paludibacteraceae bacterium]|nr:UDP-N-acetylmuramate dehydrogenase [Paludibacteraceae bacterium]
MKIEEDYSIKPHTTFGVDADVSYYVEYETEEELKELIESGFLLDREVLSLGGGSNVLFCDDFDGVVLHSEIKGIEEVERTEDTVLLRVGAGEVWDDFVAWTIAHGFYGAENLSAIPGSVGATPVQNIGAYGVEAKDLIERVECVDTKSAYTVTFEGNELAFGYRDSAFKHDLKGIFIVTRVYYRLSLRPSFKLDYGTIRKELEGKEVTLQTVREAVMRIRNSKLPDPSVTGNAGSFFRNPVISRDRYEELEEEYPGMPHYEAEGGVKIPAAWLIEQCGWKGRTLGKAGVCETQPLVLVNRGGAYGHDILELSDQIRASVRGKFGIEISPEVILVAVPDEENG